MRLSGQVWEEASRGRKGGGRWIFEINMGPTRLHKQQYGKVSLAAVVKKKQQLHRDIFWVLHFEERMVSSSAEKSEQRQKWTLLANILSSMPLYIGECSSIKGQRSLMDGPVLCETRAMLSHSLCLLGRDLREPLVKHVSDDLFSLDYSVPLPTFRLAFYK